MDHHNEMPRQKKLLCGATQTITADPATMYIRFENKLIFHIPVKILL
jgi:hypothetical protein